MSAGGDDDLDELFGGGTGQPTPRTGLVVALLIGGVVGTIAGLACLSAPGGALVLASWVIIEKEVDRVDSGFLPLSDKPRLLRLQRVVQGALVLVIGVFILQTVLLCYGFYDWFWGSMAEWFWTGVSPF